MAASYHTSCPRLMFVSSDEKFSWAEFRRAICSPQTWLTACAYFGLLSGIYSFGLFVSSVMNASP